MSDALIGMLIAGIGSLLTLIIPVIVNARKNRAEAMRMEAELDKIDMETIKALKVQVKELLIENADIQKRVRFLEDELHKYTNGLARAIKHIRKIAPDDEIPDFLMETGELKKFRDANK